MYSEFPRSWVQWGVAKPQSKGFLRRKWIYSLEERTIYFLNNHNVVSSNNCHFGFFNEPAFKATSEVLVPRRQLQSCLFRFQHLTCFEGSLVSLGEVAVPCGVDLQPQQGRCARRTVRHSRLRASQAKGLLSCCTDWGWRLSPLKESAVPLNP